MKIKISVIFFFLAYSFSFSNFNLDSLENKVFEDIKKQTITSNTIVNMQTVLSIYTSSKPEKAFLFSKRIEESLIKYNNLDLIAYNYRNIGHIYRNLDQPVLAIENYLKAKSIYQSIGEMFSSSWLNLDIGNIYYSVESYDIAESYYRKAIEDLIFFEKNKKYTDPNWDSTTFIHKGMAVANNNIALVNLQTGDTTVALHYHKLAVVNRKNQGEPFHLAHTYSYIARLYLGINDIENARKYLDSSKYFYEKITDLERIQGDRVIETVKGRGDLHLNIASYNLQNNYFDDALENYLKALNYFESIASYRMIVITLNDIGEMYFSANNRGKALEYYTRALSLANESSFPELKSIAYSKLSDYYDKIGNYKEAYKYHNLLEEINLQKLNNYKQILVQGAELRYLYNDQVSVIDKLEADKKINELQLQNSNIIIYSLILVTFLFVVMLVILYNRYDYRKKVSQILKDNNNELIEANKIIKESEGKLKKSESELRELNYAKDKFFSIIAHDLRGPISTFKSTTELLSTHYDEFDEEEKKDFSRMLADSSKSLFHLLNNLLTWTRSQSGTISFVPTEINFYAIVQNSVDLLNTSARKKSILLLNKVPKDCEFVADANLTDTIIRNLVSNAIKFTPNGGRVEITAEIEDEQIKYEIRDNGIGIPKDNINKLFRIDTNSSSPGTEGESGSGLGLVLVKEFVDRHSGKISVRSKVNVGTVFTVLIPRSLVTEMVHEEN